MAIIGPSVGGKGLGCAIAASCGAWQNFQYYPVLCDVGLKLGCGDY